MIPLPGIRDKGAAAVGARPGQRGPYGWYGADEEPGEDDLDDGPDGEQH